MTTELQYFTYASLPQHHLKNYKDKTAGPPVELSLIFVWTCISAAAFLSCIYLPNKVRQSGDGFSAANPNAAATTTMMMSLSNAMRGESDIIYVAVHLNWCLWTTVGYDIIVRLYSAVLLSERQLFIQQYLPIQVPFRIDNMVTEVYESDTAERLVRSKNMSYSRVSLNKNKRKKKAQRSSFSGKTTVEYSNSKGEFGDNYEKELIRWKEEHNSGLNAYKCWAWKEVINPLRRTVKGIATMINNVTLLRFDDISDVYELLPSLLYGPFIYILKSIFPGGNNNNVLEIEEVSLERIGCLLQFNKDIVKSDEVSRFGEFNLEDNSRSTVISEVYVGDTVSDSESLYGDIPIRASAAREQRAGFSQLSVVICSLFTSLIIWFMMLGKAHVGKIYSKVGKSVHSLNGEKKRNMMEKDDPNTTKRTTFIGHTPHNSNIGVGKHNNQMTAASGKDVSSSLPSSVTGSVMVIWTLLYLSAFAYTKAMPITMGIMYPVMVCVVVILGFALP